MIDEEAFPEVIDERAGGPPALHAGETITGFPSNDVAQVAVAGGGRSVIESATPIAVETAPRVREPISLGLVENGGSFEPQRPLVPITIPANLSEGIALTTSGLSLTPVSAGGVPLSSVGEVRDASVLFPDTMESVDNAVKPTTFGFEDTTFLRAATAPRNLYFRLGLPRGDTASLVAGVVDIEAEGQVVAVLSAPSAEDVAGTPVPVSLSLSGDLAEVSVGSQAAEYEYPIEVDPQLGTAEDRSLAPYGSPSNWTVYPSPPSNFVFNESQSPQEISDWYSHQFAHERAQAGEAAYETQGQSHIFAFSASVSGAADPETAEAQYENKLIIAKGASVEAQESLPGALAETSKAIGAATGSVGNYAAFQQVFTSAGTTGFFTRLRNTDVQISQAEQYGPKVAADTSDRSVKGQLNASFGGGTNWFSPYVGTPVIGVNASDPGVGVYKAAVTSPSEIQAANPYRTSGSPLPGCHGVQCYECWESGSSCAGRSSNEGLGFNIAPMVEGKPTSWLPNGESTVTVTVEDAAGWKAAYSGTVKVDDTPPRALTVSGLGSGSEVGEGQYPLKIEATDGTQPTRSSGIRSMALYADGRALGGPQGYCSPGPCTAKAEWSLSGSELGAGPHELTIVATDNAGNVARETKSFYVRHTTPISLGPGAVDPLSGEFSMQASDVAISAPTAGLAVGRSYHSGHLANWASPFGSQWSANMGPSEGISVAPNGTATLTASSGEQSSFARNAKGEFESPHGDSAVKLEYSEGGYAVRNASASSTTRFVQPDGLSSTPPAPASQFGSSSSAGGSLGEPQAVALDGEGNIWVADELGRQIDKFSSGGQLLGTYAGGQLADPVGIAISPTSGNIYVASSAVDAIEEREPSGKPKGVIISRYGHGAGQIIEPSDIATDANGNLWIADAGNNRVDEFTGSGTFIMAIGYGISDGKEEVETCTTQCRAGLTGKTAGEFNAPVGLTLCGVNLYVVDQRNARVDYFTTAGKYEGAFGAEGSGNGQFKTPTRIACEATTHNLYVADQGNGRVEQFTATGGFLETFGAEGQGQLSVPAGVASSATGTVYVSNGGNDTISVWNRPTWVPALSTGPASSSTDTYKFRAVTLGGRAVIQPTEELGAKPAGVECTYKALSELPRGCRLLTFVYGEHTRATETAWGEYEGRLIEVLFTAWNTKTNAAQTSPVAQYAYDEQGRLRAEWDPRISPALKTTYGYDAAGRVTSVNPPGQEPWLLHYGLLPSTASSGGLLSVIRPPAATPAELKTSDEYPAPANTAAPALSSTKPQVGVADSLASEGSWSNHPVTYAYAWERCNQAGGNCVPIRGAVNQTYYPQQVDQGQTLVGQVTAYNASGATAAVTAATSLVAAGTPSSPTPEPPAKTANSVWTVDYQVPLSGTELQTLTHSEVEKWGQTDYPEEGAAIFPPDEPMGWPAKHYRRASLTYYDILGRAVNAANPAGAVTTSEYNAQNDIVRSLSADNRATALKEGCESKEHCKSAETSKLLDTENTYEEKGSEPGTELLSTLGPQHPIQLPNGSHVEGREHTTYSYNEGAPAEAGPYHLVTKTTQGAIVAGKEEAETIRTTTYGYAGPAAHPHLGWELRKPTTVTIDPSGLDLVHTTEYEAGTGNIIESKLPAATGKDAKIPPAFSNEAGSTGTGAGQLKSPDGVALDASGNTWVADVGNNRIAEYSSTGAFIKAVGFGVADGKAEYETCTTTCLAGLAGTGSGQFTKPQGVTIAGGYVYISDSGNSRIEKLTESGEFVSAFGSKGAGALHFKEPAGITIDASGNLWIADVQNNRLQKLSASGAFLAAMGFGVSNGKAEYETCTTTCQAGLLGTGSGQFTKPQGITITGGAVYVTDTGNDRVEQLNEQGEYANAFGSAGTGNGQFTEPVGIVRSPVTGALYVADALNNRIQVFTTAGAYLAQFGIKGSGAGAMKLPEGLAMSSAGVVTVVDTGNGRIEQWRPQVTGNTGADATKTIYFSSAADEEHPECGQRPEWASLPCEIRPVAQPGGTLPELATTKYTYNIWDEPETTSQSVGATTRTQGESYDNAGRLKESSIKSSVGTAIPPVTYGYNAETGAPTTQSTTEGAGQTLTSSYNTLGQLASYTDAAGNTSSYEYDEDGRLHKTNVGIATQTNTYNPTTGQLTELTDSGAGTFAATYDAEGNMLTETFPGGLAATYSYNSLATPTGLEYTKTTHCTEKCTWFTDSIVPSISGQWMEQTSSLSHQVYGYDTAGRLTKVQNTPTGKKCVTRLYAYDEDTNRLSLTTREPNAKGECATEGGTSERHTYDTANRLTDPGTAYNTFGDITSLPEADSVGTPLTTTYYTDNQVASQRQGEPGAKTEQTIGYNLDPARRTIETIDTGTKVATTTTHYANASTTAAWETNTLGETLRDVPGIDGQLAAIQNNNGTPTLQLANLHGDLVATASSSETANKPESQADTSEYGVPTTSLPPKHAWLGSLELLTELPSGVVAMGARSYVPQVGRFLQPDPRPGGSASPYSYTFGDPVNTTDVTGELTYGLSAEERAGLNATSQEIIAREAAREAAARAAAEAAAQAAARAAANTAGPQYGGEEWEEWEEWEEGPEYEYVSHEHAPSLGNRAPAEGAVLYQSLREKEPTGDAEAGDGAVGPTRSSTAPLCKLHAGTPCTRPTGSGGGRGKLHKHKGSRGGGPSPREVGEAVLCGGAWFFGPEAGALTCAGIAVGHLPG